MCTAAPLGLVQVQCEQYGEQLKRLQPTRFSERLMLHAKVMPPLEVGNFQKRRRLLPTESWLRTSVISCILVGRQR